MENPSSLHVNVVRLFFVLPVPKSVRKGFQTLCKRKEQTHGDYCLELLGREAAKAVLIPSFELT